MRQSVTSALGRLANLMPIPVTCQCGQSFSAQLQLAGRVVKCPSCQAPLQIPHPTQPANDLLGIGGFDEQSFSSAPLSGTYPQSNPLMNSPSDGASGWGQQFAASKKRGKGLMIGLIVGGSVGMLAIIGIVVALVIKLDGNANDPVTENNNSSSTMSSWVEYESPDGGYRVMMPQHPDLQTRSHVSPAGSFLTKIATSNFGANGLYSTGHTSLPGQITQSKTKVDEMLEGKVELAVGGLQGTLGSKKNLQILGHPGVEIVVIDAIVGGQPTAARAQFFITDKMLYQKLWMGPPGDENKQDIQEFFDSFKLE